MTDTARTSPGPSGTPRLRSGTSTRRRSPERRGVRQPRLRHIVIHNYRWRLGVAPGESQYDEIEARLARGPVITVPTVTLDGDANGAPHPDPSTYSTKFSAKYVHRTITGGVGHNLPQEAPERFVDAVMEVDGFS
jgi:pimeloyl-ACP methyl ester carboxylesterase